MKITIGSKRPPIVYYLKLLILGLQDVLQLFDRPRDLPRDRNRAHVRPWCSTSALDDCLMFFLRIPSGHDIYIICIYLHQHERLFS